jgi:peptidase inhibitor family I36
MKRAVLALMFLLVAFPQPAQADGRAQCRAGELCVWEHDDYKGCFARLPQEDKDYRDGAPSWENCPGVTVNDKISSYVNNTSHWAGFWMTPGRKDLALCVTPGGESPDLKNLANPESYEDRISSHYTFVDWGAERPAFFYPDGGYCYVYDEN